MTLTLDLPRELENRLKCEAELRGLSESEYAIDLLKRHLPPLERKERLDALLDSIIEESKNSSEADDGEEILRAIDEDRLADRKLYPPELKGVTW